MNKDVTQVEDDKTQEAKDGHWTIQWEYHRMKTSDKMGVPATTLNDLGRQGWELVAVFPIHAELNYIFKKPRPVE